MKSKFVHSELSGIDIKRNIISTPDYKVRIVGRYPSSGYPKSGQSFAIDVELQTNINMHGLFRIPFVCPDATVAVRDESTNEILAKKFISTRWLNTCTGVETLRFTQGWVPSQNRYVRLEVYPGYESEITGTPVVQSEPFTLDNNIDEGKSTGQYGDQHSSVVDSLNTDIKQLGIDGLNSVLRKVVIISAIGAGAYFAGPLFPILKNKIKSIAGD